MPIQKATDISKGLTTYTVNGKVTPYEILNEIQSFYDGVLTPNVLWDISDAILWEFNAKHMEILSSFRSRFSQGSNRKKTGLIASEEHAQNLSTWFKEYGELGKLPFPVRVFKAKSDAIQWFSMD